ncbi:MAG: glutathione S-transferase family protein [Alphaproteobacteria bacterium]|nr:glutathione S-transferase family protein [Alphaproteobacteria bacterium]
MASVPSPPGQIVLHQYRQMYGLPNASPFCIKLETYLRMAGFDHRIEPARGSARSPTGKAPFIRLGDEIIADSGLIISQLESRFGNRVEGKLTLAERAQSLALQRLMEEHLYWAIVYARWLDPDNAKHVTGYVKDVTGLPGWLMPIVGSLIQKQVKKALHAHGLGRHDAGTLWAMGIGDVQALAHWLGNRAWGFGDQPTVIDAVLFAFFASITHTPWDFPLKTQALKHRNLVDHSARMLAKYFPDMEKAA